MLINWLEKMLINWLVKMLINRLVKMLMNWLVMILIYRFGALTLLRRVSSSATADTG